MADLQEILDVINEKVPSAPEKKIDAADTNLTLIQVAEFAGQKVDQATKVNGKELSGDVTLTKTDIGLSSVDNTADLNKPISTPQRTEINNRPKASTLTALRANTENLTSFYMNSFGLEGLFQYQSFDTSSADDGIRIIRDGNGRRFWRQNFPNRINVKWAGAKGDGSTDDTAAFQAVLNLVGVNTFVGNTRTVYIPDGLYILGKLTIPANINIKIEGDSKATTLKLKALTNQSMFVCPQTAYVEFDSLYLDGNKGNQTVTGNSHGIEFLDGAITTYVRTGSMRHLNIVNFDGDGIHGGMYKQLVVLEDVECRNNNRDGIYQPKESSDWFLDTVQCGNNGRYGFFAGNLAQIINSNFFFNEGSGIGLGLYQRWSHISGCQVDKNGKHGIEIIAAATDIVGNPESCGVIIEGCRFDNNSQLLDNAYSHIYVEDGAGVKIDCNDFLKSPTDTFVTTKRPKYIVQTAGVAKILWGGLNRMDANAYRDTEFTNDISKLGNYYDDLYGSVIDTTSTAYTKATLNAAYPKAKKGFEVIQDALGKRYTKKDFSSTGNWSVITGNTQLT